MRPGKKADRNRTEIGSHSAPHNRPTMNPVISPPVPPAFTSLLFHLNISPSVTVSLPHFHTVFLNASSPHPRLGLTLCTFLSLTFYFRLFTALSWLFLSHTHHQLFFLLAVILYSYSLIFRSLILDSYRAARHNWANSKVCISSEICDSAHSLPSVIWILSKGSSLMVTLHVAFVFSLCASAVNNLRREDMKTNKLLTFSSNTWVLSFLCLLLLL